MKDKKIIIGITGAFGSGKSTAAKFFESKGFRTLTLSSFLEEEIKKKTSSKITRRLLQDKGNELRKKYGSGILAQKALQFLNKENVGKAVIDGIRNTGEIDQLRKNDNFTLLAIVADKQVRFSRLSMLKRREQLTPETFRKLDRRDLGLGQKETGLHVAECIAMADVFIDNNSGVKDFENKLKEFLQKI